MTVCCCQVTCAFQIEMTLNSCLNVKKLLAGNGGNVWSLSNGNRILTNSHLFLKQTLNHLAKLTKCRAVLWVLICTGHLTVYSYHVTYVFQSEYTFYSCLNVKELLAQNKHNIWSLSDSLSAWHDNKIQSNAPYR